jgi:hypothetical protein
MSVLAGTTVEMESEVDGRMAGLHAMQIRAVTVNIPIRIHVLIIYVTMLIDK